MVVEQTKLTTLSTTLLTVNMPFSKSRVWDKVSKNCTLIFRDYQIPFQHVVEIAEGSISCQK